MTERVLVLVVGLVVLVAAGPTLVCLAAALLPLVLVLGILAVALRLVWFYTSRW